MRAAATRAVVMRGRVDTLETWFLEQAQTPTGSILLFLLVFLTRIALDHHHRTRAAKKTHRKAKV